MSKNLAKVILSGILLGTSLRCEYGRGSIAEINNYERVVEEYQTRKEEIKRIKQEEELLLKKDYIFSTIHDLYPKINLQDYLSEKFIRAIICIESGDNPLAISSVGARGLGQLTEGAWREGMGNLSYEKYVFNPKKNIEATMRYLKWIDEECEKHHSNWEALSPQKKLEIIASAYNGGINRLIKKNFDTTKMPGETRLYLMKIEKNSEKFIPSEGIWGVGFL